MIPAREARVNQKAWRRKDYKKQKAPELRGLETLSVMNSFYRAGSPVIEAMVPYPTCPPEVVPRSLMGKYSVPLLV